MSVFEAQRLHAVTGGQWLRGPSPGLEVHGVGTDSREPLAGRAFVALVGEHFDGHDYLDQAVLNGAAMLVVERDDRLPSTSIPTLLVDDVRRALARFAASHRDDLAGVVIAITGSAGKTTTKRLIDAVLGTTMQGTAAPRSFNNDIGVPLSILGASPGDAYVVLELGTNAPGEIDQLAAMVRPDIAVITGVGHSHIEGLGSVEGVWREKSAVLQHTRADGLVLLPDDLPWPMPDLEASIEPFGVDGRATWRLTERGHDATESWMTVNGQRRVQLSLPGRHNAMNALIAIAIGRRFGMPWSVIEHGLASVEPEPGRFVARQIGEVTLYDDSYNANPESVLAGLETFVEVTPTASRRFVILGDMLELGETSRAQHQRIGERLATLMTSRTVNAVVLIGEEIRAAKDVLEASGCADLVRHEKELGGAHIDDLAPPVQDGDAVYVKGSRGMRLERIVESLRSRASSSSLG